MSLAETTRDRIWRSGFAASDESRARPLRVLDSGMDFAYPSKLVAARARRGLKERSR
jgi:hypothetical protein